TFSVKEDEEVVLDLLARRPECTLIRTAAYPGFRPGVLPCTEACIRLYTHCVEGEGHFAAVIRKGSGERAERAVRQYVHQLPDFFRMVKKDFSHREIIRKGDKLYALPEEPLQGKQVRALRTGLFLGTMKKNGFEPSQALAMTLDRESFGQCVCFDAEDERVMRYLRGETVFADEEKSGWVLVCADRWPLGFAKASGKALKNRIDPGWRRQ
ncbi:MAG: RsmF rRNA methyltransferase first C-terminal domain-containing protein, partial [Solobacterium sp.]|nr:RsmF rRNA methyltransferase first C-terminal domain-containing protein [Solobacterium sp.]